MAKKRKVIKTTEEVDFSIGFRQISGTLGREVSINIRGIDGYTSIILNSDQFSAAMSSLVLTGITLEKTRVEEGE